MPAVGRDSGGPVLPGQTYTVGERGPERFVTNGSGYIMANRLMRLTMRYARRQGITLADAARAVGERHGNKTTPRLLIAAARLSWHKRMRPDKAWRMVARVYRGNVVALRRHGI